MSKKFITNLLKGSAASSIGTVSTVIFHFLSIMVMARYVEKDEFGIYLLIMVVVQCVKIIAGLGLDLTLVKFITGKMESVKNTLFSIVLIRILQLSVISLLFLATAQWVLPLLDARLLDYLYYLPVLFALASFRELFFFFLQGLKQFKKYAMLQSGSALVKLMIIGSFVYLGQLGLTELIYVDIATYALSMLAQLLLTRFPEGDRFNYSFQRIRKILTFAFPLYLNNMLTFLYRRISILSIATFINPIAVAYYEIAKKIPDGFARIFKSFIVVYFPNLSSLFSRGQTQEARKLMNQSLVLFSTSTVFLVLVAFLFHREITLLIFSEKYLETSLAFACLMFNFYLRSICNLMGYSLVSAGQPSAPVKANSISSIINGIGCLIMVPYFGYIGAIYSLICMNIISQGIYYRYLAKIDMRPLATQYLKPLLFAGALIGSYQLLGIENFLLKFLYLGGYLVIAWIFIREFRSVLQFFAKFLHRLKPGWGSAG